MPLWKQLLLNLYYHATLPVRWRNCRRMAAEDRLPAIVLFWHRIADDRATPWTVSNATFARQIRWLAEPVSIRLAGGDAAADPAGLQPPAVRQPHLRRRLRRQLPAGHSPAGPGADSLHVLRHVAERAGGAAVPARPGRRPSLRSQQLEQLRAMAAAGVEIGAHTYTHADLGGDRRRRRCCTTKWSRPRRTWSRLLGRPVRYFAFPYGQPANLAPAAFELARRGRLRGRVLGLRRLQFPRRRPLPSATHRRGRRHDPLEELGHDRPAETPHAAVRVSGTAASQGQSRDQASVRETASGFPIPVIIRSPIPNP